jgi:hypothetical protein
LNDYTDQLRRKLLLEYGICGQKDNSGGWQLWITYNAQKDEAENGASE